MKPQGDEKKYRYSPILLFLKSALTTISRKLVLYLQPATKV